MVKNMTDILFGGFTFGYLVMLLYSEILMGLSQRFFTDKDNNYGWLFSNFFQFTFSVVSGCLAERTNFSLMFSMLNTFIYSVPAHWVWNKNGWLYKLGVVDFAGCGPVHMVGGLTGLVGTCQSCNLKTNLIP